MATVVKRNIQSDETKTKIPYIVTAGPKAAILKALDRRLRLISIEKGDIEDTPQNRVGFPLFRFITTKTKKHNGHYSYEISEFDDNIITFVMRKSTNPNVNGLDFTGEFLKYDMLDEMDQMKGHVRNAVREFYTDDDRPHIKTVCITKRHLVSLDETTQNIKSKGRRGRMLGTVDWVKITFRVSYNVTWPVDSLFDMSQGEKKEYG